MELLALEWRKFHTFEFQYLWSQLANLNQILCGSSLGWGKGCKRFWGRLTLAHWTQVSDRCPLGYLFALAWVFFLLLIFLLISEVIQGTEETVRLVLDWMCLSAEFWIKEVIKLKFSCTEQISGKLLKYFSFANSNASFLIDSKSPFWYKNTFLRGFFIGGMTTFKVPRTI